VNDPAAADREAAEPEALALIEFDSIAVGTRAVDALIKKAPVQLERMGTLQPGKLAVLFSGDVASVDESYGEALRVGALAVQDKVMLPLVEASVYRATLAYPATLAGAQSWHGDTLGILETSTMAATLEGADAAVKGALVRVTQMRLGDQLGGKGLAHFVGELHDVEAALAIACDKIRDGSRRVTTSLTPRIDDELIAHLSKSTRFWASGEGSR